jgi:hypothetical protein
LSVCCGSTSAGKRRQRPQHEHVDEQPQQARREEGHGQRAGQRQVQPRDGLQRRIGAHHEDGAMRQVDHAQHAEDQREAEREQRVDAAERECVEELLFEHVLAWKKAGPR